MVSSPPKSKRSSTDSGEYPPGGGSSLEDRYLRIADWVRAQALVLATLLGGFVARLLVADRNSYWLDEIYSVTIHGAWNENAIELVRVLANGGVYPPIYFVGLFEWMSWFGDSEAATRFLSNVFIALATLFLYLAVRQSHARRIALGSAVVFSLMYTPMFYGLEARPYALGIFLAIFSSYLFLRIAADVSVRGWRLAVVSPTGSLLVLANAALLLTHYYNVFFVAAQGLFALVFVMREVRPRYWLRGLGAIAAIYGASITIFLGIWGRVALHGVNRFGGAYSIDGVANLRNPFLVLVNGLIKTNFNPPGLLWWVSLAVVVLVGLSSAVLVIRRDTGYESRRPAWSVLYMLNWLITPFLWVWIAFAVVGVARYSNRFFVFSIGALAPLIVLGIEYLIRTIGGAWRRFRDSGSTSDVGLRFSYGLLLSIVVVTLVLPRGYAAAANPKDDWRGTAEDIAELMASNPDSTFAVLETSFRSVPVLDYHLARTGEPVSVFDTIQRLEERREGPFRFEARFDELSEFDYVVVAFIHHSTRNFPRALDRLGNLFSLDHWHVGSNGKGLVVFATNSSEASP